MGHVIAIIAFFSAISFGIKYQTRSVRFCSQAGCGRQSNFVKRGAITADHLKKNSAKRESAERANHEYKDIPLIETKGKFSKQNRS